VRDVNRGSTRVGAAFQACAEHDQPRIARGCDTR
jgi:hypothetical protein